MLAAFSGFQAELHFIEPRASPANAINTAAVFQKEWTCEVISKGIRHLISAVYGFVCGWSVGEGLAGFGEVIKGHCLRRVGGGTLVISLLDKEQNYLSK